MNVLVTGYYGRHNLGDDAFEQVIPLVVGTQNTYRFVCVDDLVRETVDPNDLYDVVLLGAGDVVNVYFFRKMQAYLRGYVRGPVLLFGAGITWPSCVGLGHLDQFDSVFLRNTTDLRRAERRLGTEWVHFVPDVAFALKPYFDESKGDTLTTSTADDVDVVTAVTTRTANDTLEAETQKGGKEEEEEVVGGGDNGGQMKEARRRPQAGIFLIQSIDQKSPDDAVRQQRVLDHLAECIAYVARTHDVTMVRFNSSGTRDGDDVHISQRLARMLGDERVRVDYEPYRTPQAMLRRMATFDVHVCMRFHSHVFSVVQQVPFVSLALTRKVRMLVDELGLADECAVFVERNEETLKPLSISVSQFRERFDYVVANSDALRQRLHRLYSTRHALLHNGVYRRLVETARVRPGRRLAQDNETLIDSLVNKASRWWRHRLKFRLDDENARSLALDTYALTPLDGQSRVRRHVTTVCERVCYAITNQVHAPYMYGFIDSMMRDPFRVREYVEWIVNDHAHKATTRDDGRRFNLDYIRQQDFTGAHRSGWAFAVDHLRALHSEHGVYLDTCMDRTFHWGCDALSQAGVLPYTHSWCGIVHHTPLEQYTDYNVASMVRNPVFQQSLITCRGIYVLSEALKRWLEETMHAMCLDHVPLIEVLQHPTEVPPRGRRFSLRRFRTNKSRKLVHIGAWLRDTFAMYEMGLLDVADRETDRAEWNLNRNRRNRRRLSNKPLNVGFIRIGNCRRTLRRCMLRGRNMGLYMPPDALYIGANGNQDDEGCGACRHDCGACRHDGDQSSIVAAAAVSIPSGEGRGTETTAAAATTTTNTTTGAGWSERFETQCNNKWVQGLCRYVDERVRTTVELLEGLDDEAYDALLCENIVFLRLYDASACNTLIECVVRNTPILINRLPAVEEVLGKDYPLYYSSLAEALAKSRRYDLVADAHRYLRRLDKSHYRVESFVEQVRASSIYKSLGNSGGSGT